jgi:hypothetical protein
MLLQQLLTIAFTIKLSFNEYDNQQVNFLIRIRQWSATTTVADKE